ncbi:MAG: hypothetical protein HRU06_14855 [Oceanospirillaceae bacterium]|nr:hypothetical protein [Oceanospirillaceae bacterium]
MDLWPILFLVLSGFFLSACGNNESEKDNVVADVSISESIAISSYTIVKDTNLATIKRSVDVILDAELSVEALTAIAVEIKKSDSKKYDRTFIIFNLSTDAPNAAAWATGHSNPNLKIEILRYNTLGNTAAVTGTGKWYENSGLHKASISDWKRAARENKIGTAADWTLSGAPTIKKQVMDSGDFDNLKPFANALVNCIDIAVEGTAVDHQEAAMFAVLCMSTMGWLK